MNELRISNLRSLKDTGYIRLAPLTVLVGQNSSGKSTFLRTLPLLKQTFERQVQGPLLFWGQYVDFGDFNTAITRGVNSGDDSIILGFRQTVSTKQNVPIYIRRSAAVFKSKVEVEYEVEIKNLPSDEVYICRLSCRFLGYQVLMEIQPNRKISKLIVNEEDFSQEVKNLYAVGEGRLCPIFAEEEATGDNKGRLYAIGYRSNKPTSTNTNLPLHVERKFISVVNRFVHANTSQERVLNMLRETSVSEKDKLRQDLLKLPDAPNSWKTHTKNWGEELTYARELRVGRKYNYIKRVFHSK